MTLIVDPRKGDVADDVCSTKQRSLFSLGGSLLAEISLPKLAVAWVLLIGLPALLLGVTPLLASIWVAGVSAKVYSLFTGLWPALLLVLLAVLGWFGGRSLLRLVESSFWSLNALAVQPAYVLCREAVRHLVEYLLPPSLSDDQLALARSASAGAAGLLIFAVALWLAAWIWPSTHWLGNLSDLASFHRLAAAAWFNSVALIAGYLAIAALMWGLADATMGQPRIGCVLLNMAMGTHIIDVPYRGSGPAMQDLIAGRTDFFCEALPTALPQINADTVKALAILSRNRASVLPNLSSAQEQGLASFDAYSWFAFFFPRGTPDAIVRRLQQATIEATRKPSVRSRLKNLAPPWSRQRAQPPSISMSLCVARLRNGRCRSRKAAYRSTENMQGPILRFGRVGLG